MQVDYLIKRLRLRLGPHLLLNVVGSANLFGKFAGLNPLQTSSYILSQEAANFFATLGKHARAQVGGPNRVRLIKQHLSPAIEPRGCQP